MITYLATWSSRATVDRYLASWGRPLFGRISPMTYERFGELGTPRPGVYLFSDIDLLNDAQRRQAGEAYERMTHLAGPYRLVNHPARSMRRDELLTTLAERHTNAFRIHRADGPLFSVRFPAFLRLCHAHAGTAGGLLGDHYELEKAIERAKAGRRPLSEYIVVEFCDTRDRMGVFRKFSAFRVWNRIIPRHVFFSQDWAVRQADKIEPGYLKQEWDYLEQNPHETQLMEIFELARIQYGRIDYSLLDDRIQTWEINTNPTILTFEQSQEPSRHRVHEAFTKRLQQAWEDVDSGMPGQPPYVTAQIRTLARVGRHTLKWHTRQFQKSPAS